MMLNKKSLYDGLPLIVFGGLTLLGAIVITSSKVAGLSPLITVFIPIVLMFVYLGLSQWLRKIQLHDEQTGDNLYYMGFLFTLTSLGVSLYQFTSDGSMDDVVRNFGIAITSTIVGIALRILFNQTRRDVQDIERATRHDLATMARLVRAEMEVSRREFTEFRRINSQMINEGFTEIIEQTDTVSKKLSDALGGVVKEAVKPIERASTQFEVTLSSSIKDNTVKLDNISTLLDNSVSKIEKTAGRIGELQLPSEVIKNDLTPVIKEMGKLMSELITRFEEGAREQSKVFSEVAGKLNETQNDQSKASKGVTDAISQLVEQTKVSINHMVQLIETSKETVQKSVNAVKQSEEIATVFKDNVTRTEKIEEQIEKSRNEIRSLKDILNRILSVMGAKSDKQGEATAAASEKDV